MRMSDYFKENAIFLMVHGTAFVLTASVLAILQIHFVWILSIFCLWFVPMLSLLLIQAFRRVKYYNQFQSTLEALDQKYLLPEVMETASFAEFAVLSEVLETVSRDMHEHVKSYRDKQADYREFIETWVHEIKTPVASAKLIIENNPDAVTQKIDTQIERIDAYIEQVLYYARSNDVSQDYIVNTLSLESVIKTVVRKHAREFIGKGVKLELGELDFEIHSDVKWLTFILSQLVSNAVKYSRDTNAVIHFYAVQHPNAIVLWIEDNGIGIDVRDLPRVFDKGFTGENGRKFGRATGMGLYLCRKLCGKLGIGIQLSSELGTGTQVALTFPIGNLTKF